MKQNSTENMILCHLKDIKAKIEQKSIHNMKLPFEGPFKNKYAGRMQTCFYIGNPPIRNESGFFAQN